MDPEEPDAEATLELTILSADGLKVATFLGRPARAFAVAWLDPQLKKSTPSLPVSPHSQDRDPFLYKLHFPLSPRLLRNPSAALTLQILASRLPLLPRNGTSAKLVGSASLPLASLPAAAAAAGEPLTLPLRRPSGRAHGSVRVSARILWCVGPIVAGFPAIAGESRHPELLRVEPTAPPLPPEEDFLVHSAAAPPFPPGEGFRFELSTAPVAPKPAMQAEEGSGFEWAAPAVPEESLMVEEETVQPPQILERNQNGAWVSFLTGLVSGALAAVLVGAAALSDDG